MESISVVSVGQIIGLISILYDEPELANICDISDEIEKDFGETIAIVKAAEILELMDTPKNEVQLIALGRRFHERSRKEWQQIFPEQLYKLRLFHIILAYLKVSEKVDAERVLQHCSHDTLRQPGKSIPNHDRLGSFRENHGLQCLRENRIRSKGKEATAQ